MDAEMRDVNPLITAKEWEVRTEIPDNLPLDDFVGLAPVTEVDLRISEREKVCGNRSRPCGGSVSL